MAKECMLVARRMQLFTAESFRLIEEAESPAWSCSAVQEERPSARARWCTVQNPMYCLASVL